MTEFKRAYLVALQESAGMSCAELARRCNVAPSTVSTWVSGFSVPHPVNERKWEHAVEVAAGVRVDVSPSVDALRALSDAHLSQLLHRLELATRKSLRQSVSSARVDS